MQDEKQYLAELFQKYQEGTVTEKEKEILTRWLVQLKANDQELTVEELQVKQQDSLAALRNETQADLRNETQADSINKAYANKTHADVIETTDFQQKRKIRFSLWTTAIAAMLCIISGIYFYTQKHGQPVVINKVANNDLLPGTNKAMLTLSDGSTINLNAADNGVLAQQGNISVKKSAKGKVIYTENNASAGQPATAALFNTISTPKGGAYQVVLPDGTKAWLNAASYIRFPTVFEGGKREVEIGGEVYFEVVKNMEKPFLVTCIGQKLTVLGTHFNINAYAEEAAIKTTLLEGSVKISNGVHQVILKPGQQSRISANGKNEIKVSSDIDLDEVIAWKNGLFQFNKADISTIMNQIARWYDVDVEISDKLPVAHYRGTIPRNVNASKVLKIMELGGIHFTIEGRKIIVKP